MANFAPPLDPPMFVHVNKQAYIQCVFFQQNLNNVLTNKVCTYATYTMLPDLHMSMVSRLSRGRNHCRHLIVANLFFKLIDSLFMWNI
jgi:hypothetical protein